MSILCHQKKYLFFLFQISKKEYKKCEVEIIEKGRYFWLNREDLEVESDVASWAQIFDKCDWKEQKHRHELMPITKFQQYKGVCTKWFSQKKNCRKKKKKKSCRKSSKRFLEFQKKLGLDPNLVTCDERDIISAIQVLFEGEIILNQYFIENIRIDAYFSE